MGSSESNFTKPAEVEQGGFHVFELHMPSAAYSGFFVIFVLLLVFFGIYFCLKKCNLCKRFLSFPKNDPHHPTAHPNNSGEPSQGKVYLSVQPSQNGSYSVSIPEFGNSGIRGHNVRRGLPRAPTVKAPVIPPSAHEHIYTPPGRRNSLLSLLEPNPEKAETPK